MKPANLLLLLGGGYILLKDQFKNNPSCPSATTNLKTNTLNRNKAIRAPWIQYGPLNLSDNKYWKKIAKHWNTTEAVAKESRCYNCVAFDISPRMIECMSAGPTSEDILDMTDGEGVLGYCWMHSFKCHSARSCYTWAGGGPITKNKVSYEWERKAGA